MSRRNSATSGRVPSTTTAPPGGAATSGVTTVTAGTPVTTTTATAAAGGSGMQTRSTPSILLENQNRRNESLRARTQAKQRAQSMVRRMRTAITAMDQNPTQAGWRKIQLTIDPLRHEGENALEAIQVHLDELLRQNATQADIDESERVRQQLIDELMDTRAEMEDSLSRHAAVAPPEAQPFLASLQQAINAQSVGGALLQVHPSPQGGVATPSGSGGGSPSQAAGAAGTAPPPAAQAAGTAAMPAAGAPPTTAAPTASATPSGGASARQDVRAAGRIGDGGGGGGQAAAGGAANAGGPPPGGRTSTPDGAATATGGAQIPAFAPQQSSGYASHYPAPQRGSRASSVAAGSGVSLPANPFAGLSFSSGANGNQAAGAGAASGPPGVAAGQTPPGGQPAAAGNPAGSVGSSLAVGAGTSSAAFYGTQIPATPAGAARAAPQPAAAAFGGQPSGQHVHHGASHGAAGAGTMPTVSVTVPSQGNGRTVVYGPSGGAGPSTGPPVGGGGQLGQGVTGVAPLPAVPLQAAQLPPSPAEVARVLAHLGQVQGAGMPQQNLDVAALVALFQSQLQGQMEATVNMLRLPVIEVPKFNGNAGEDYARWKQSFQQVYDRQAGLRPEDKFNQLLTKVGGSALEIIESLHIEAASYQQAWDLLDRSYGDPERWLNQLRAKLDAAAPVKTNRNVKGFRSLYNILVSLWRNYQNLGRDHNGAGVLQAALPKFSYQVQEKWVGLLLENPEKKDDIESFIDLAGTALRKAEAVDNLNLNRQGGKGEEASANKGKAKKEASADLLYVDAAKKKPAAKAASSGGSGAPRGAAAVAPAQPQNGGGKAKKVRPKRRRENPLPHHPVTCEGCNTRHHEPEMCPVFKRLEPVQRRSWIWQLKRCRRCLKHGHYSQNCPNRDMFCEAAGCYHPGTHHTLLHGL